MTDTLELPKELKYNDKWHSYYLDGKRAKGVTTLAKIPDDTFGLDMWRKRKVAEGMGLRPDLVERAAAHIGEKQMLDDIAEEAMGAARAHEAAARGTAAHRITERNDLGEMVVDTPYSRAVLAAWNKALDDAGLVMLDEYVERIVVYPEFPLCGTFDRIARRKFDGSHVIVDLKTGAKALDYPHAMAIQLAVYANAPLIAGPIPKGGGSTKTFAPMPQVNKRVGYIIAMPDDETTVQVKTVDIVAGWDAFQKIVSPTLEWRARRDLVHDIETTTVTPYTDNIKARLGVLKAVDGGREFVAGHWPADTPFKPPWDETQGKAILATIERAEQALAVPF